MAELSDLQRSVIVRLRLDPTQQKEGYAQAKQIQANANTEMLAMDAQRQRIRGQIESDYSREFIRQAQTRIAALDQEMAMSISKSRTASGVQLGNLQQAYVAASSQREALVAQLAGYDALQKKLGEINVQFREQSALSKEAKIAAAGFKQTGGGSGWEQFGNRRVLEGFTMGGAAQMVGLGAFAAGLPIALHEIGKAFVDASFGATEFAHGLDLVSQKTGISMENLQIIGATGKTVGLSLDDMVIATRRFSIAMTGGTGTDTEGLAAVNIKGAKTLKALGISSRDASGNMRDMNAVMEDVAQKFKEAPGGAEKAAIAVTLFGRSGLTLIPYLNKGKAGLAELRGEFGQYSTDLTDAVKAQEKWNEATAIFGLAITDMKSGLSGLVEVLAAVLQNMTAFYLTAAPLANQMRDQAQASGLKGTLTPAGISEMEFLTGPFNKGSVAQGFLAPARESLAGRGINRPTDGMVAVEAVRLENEKLKAQGKSNDLLIRENVLAKDSTEEFKKAALIAAGAREEMEKKLALAREALKIAQQEAQVEVDKARAKGERGSGAFELITITKVQGDLFGTQMAERKLSGNDLIKNLEEQKRLTKELATLEAARQESIVLHKNAKEQLDRIKDLQEQARLIDEMIQKSKQDPAPDGIFNKIIFGHGPKAPDMIRENFRVTQEQFTQTQGQLDVHAITPQAGLDKLKEERGVLQDNISAELLKLSTGEKGTALYKMDVELLKEMLALQGKITEETKKTAQQTPMGMMLGSIKEMEKIIGEFAPGLNKAFSGAAASVAAISAGMQGFRTLGENQQGPGKAATPGTVWEGFTAAFGKGSTTKDHIIGAQHAVAMISGFVGAIQTISQAKGGISGLFMGALTGAGVGAQFGPIGAVVGAVGGALFGGITGMKRAAGQAMLKQIHDSFHDIQLAYGAGTTSLADTITQIQALRAKAVADTRGGKKGNQTQMQAEIDAMDSQLNSLKKQQKAVLDSFRSQIGIFSLPTGAQDVAKEILNIATALKTAADAGATAAEQIKYLNGAMDALKTKTAGGLRTDAQDTLNLMKQTLDLQKQRADLETSYQDSVLNVKRSLGLAPALTPEQSAAKQLRDLKKQHDDQLAQIDEQAATLKAQLDGRMQLFGWTQAELNASTARATILSQQLVIERAITAETIARITATEGMLAQMAAGRIPSLPAGVLPPGFSFPTGAGATYNQTITINFPTSPMNKDDAAAMLQDALAQINKGRQIGLH